MKLNVRLLGAAAAAAAAVTAVAAAARLQWIGSSFRGDRKPLSGSAGLCVCRPRSACYFLEVIRTYAPPSEKGSYDKWQP